MRESELLEHIYRRSADFGGSVVVGPGDDAAVVETAAGERLLLTVDQLVEGRHFTAGTPIDGIARKVLARNVSDIAAMAGETWLSLGTAALPAGFEGADELFDAMARWARHWGCPLVGGDISGTDGPLMLTVTLIGIPHGPRGPVLRSTARVGDGVYVTGRLGGAWRADGSGRHLAIEPRIAEARWLAGTLGGRLTSMIDLSDGLGIDAGRVARSSGVRIELESGLIPVHEDTEGWRAALGDGEDHELCFTASDSGPGMAMPESCPGTGTPIARVGRVVEGSGCWIRTDCGELVDAKGMGWDHG
jgi:thiamine-monophosphate kinase